MAGIVFLLTCICLACGYFRDRSPVQMLKYPERRYVNTIEFDGDTDEQPSRCRPRAATMPDDDDDVQLAMALSASMHDRDSYQRPASLDAVHDEALREFGVDEKPATMSRTNNVVTKGTPSLPTPSAPPAPSAGVLVHNV